MKAAVSDSLPRSFLHQTQVGEVIGGAGPIDSSDSVMFGHN